MNANATAPVTEILNASGAPVQRCICGNFADANTGERLECRSATTRQFAPGHDARLKGHLIRIGRAGNDVRIVGSDAPVPVKVAASGFGFYAMVVDGIERPAKVRKPKAAKPATVTAKVGRWTYEGVILAAGDGTPVFRYTNKKGEVVDTFKFTQV